MCRWGGESAEVKALLETHELILRGALKKTVPFADMKSVHAEGEHLCFKVGRESVALSLGAKDAISWAKKIATPPPALRDKLGLKDGAKALVIGPVQDAALAEALEGAITKAPAKAAIVVAVVENEKGLANTLRACPSGAPIWIVHRKGKDAAFGENAVRAAMRAKGFIDTKVSAVSADFSATRYAQRRALRR
jgi:hypothetical protein